uniref:SWI/SNF-related matrix-associated actin-dependent regulator of chromatin subfamily A containing DEAD/H box 1 n=1 Tax=Rhizophora mucronata TaxID=61149 RepID=A0A2P2KRD7_RHIMU
MAFIGGVCYNGKKSGICLQRSNRGISCSFTCSSGKDARCKLKNCC